MVDVAERIDKFKENEVPLMRLLIIILILCGILGICFPNPIVFVNNLVHIETCE